MKRNMLDLKDKKKLMEVFLLELKKQKRKKAEKQMFLRENIEANAILSSFSDA